MPVSRNRCIFLYVGLGEGSALPVGVPVPWPSATPPTGWLKCNGAAFSAEEYPELAKAYPTNKLPDLRGEFIRGWDDGRGVDEGREILSAQGDAMRNLTGSIEGRTAGAAGRIFGNNANGVFSATGEGGNFITPTESASASSDRLSNVTLDASRQVSTANEFRPRSIAFNYIVRAA
ncbi:phage tail protein [Escherichia coli]|nr:tail fiber protein [Escherichia coli]ELU4447894.1 tail fiber protein [Escherichia coli]